MYGFNEEHVFDVIKEHWLKFAETTNNKKWVVGISGGIDSTTVAALACKIFGKDNVVGVSLPCDGQKDMEDVNSVFWCLGIKRVTIDVGDAFHSIIDQIDSNVIDVTYDTKTNLPARLRMSTLFAVAQSVHGMVLNTCNMSESVVGYDTFGGDDMGSYAPIQDLVKTEVRALAKWLGVPAVLAEKTSIDGLQPLTDEEKLGMMYADLDQFIRTNIGSDELKKNVLDRYTKNKFKMDIIRLPGPKFGYPNYIYTQNCKIDV